jgi:hypothetical protein
VLLQAFAVGSSALTATLACDASILGISRHINATLFSSGASAGAAAPAALPPASATLLSLAPLFNHTNVAFVDLAPLFSLPRGPLPQWHRVWERPPAPRQWQALRPLWPLPYLPTLFLLWLALVGPSFSLLSSSSTCAPADRGKERWAWLSVSTVTLVACRSKAAPVRCWRTRILAALIRFAAPPTCLSLCPYSRCHFAAGCSPHTPVCRTCTLPLRADALDRRPLSLWRSILPFWILLSGFVVLIPSPWFCLPSPLPLFLSLANLSSLSFTVLRIRTRVQHPRE